MKAAKSNFFIKIFGLSSKINSHFIQWQCTDSVP